MNEMEKSCGEKIYVGSCFKRQDLLNSGIREIVYVPSVVNVWFFQISELNSAAIFNSNRVQKCAKRGKKKKYS